MLRDSYRNSLAGSRDYRSRQPGSPVWSAGSVAISLPLCAPSSKSEGVEKAIFRPEEMDQQILTEGTLACGGS